MADLWPDDIGENLQISPATVLREQASALGEKTKNIVEAEVSMLNSEFSGTNTFIYAFIIIAPALKKYKYNLFSISHDIRLYPVEFNLDLDLLNEVNLQEGRQEKMISAVDFESALPGETQVLAKTEEDFLRILRIILNAKKTRYIIGALLAQSVGVGIEKKGW